MPRSSSTRSTIVQSSLRAAALIAFLCMPALPALAEEPTAGDAVLAWFADFFAEPEAGAKPTENSDGKGAADPHVADPEQAALAAAAEPFPGHSTNKDEPRLVTELTGELQPLGNNLMGDSVELDRGTLAVTHTDVSLRGNSSLPVSFGRRYAVDGIDYMNNVLGGWNLDVPYLTARYVRSSPWPNERCTQTPRPGGFARPQDIDSFWSGVKVTVPGDGPRVLLFAPTGGTGVFGPSLPRYTTENHWRFTCLPTIQNATGEGFLGISPAGFKYRFDHLAKSDAGPVQILQFNITIDSERKRTVGYRLETYDTDHFTIYATRVEDPSGNWVNYNYTDGRLTSIESNDGRRIDVTYEADNRRIASVRVNERTWTYGYVANNNVHKTLTRVTLPDATAWEFNLPFQDKDHVALPCELEERNPGPSTGFTEHTIRHPNGTLATYRLTVISNGKTSVPATFNEFRDANDSVVCNDYTVTPFSLSTAVTRRTLVVPAGGTYAWTYAYDEDMGFFGAPPDPAKLHKKRAVTDPNGNVTSVFINRTHGSAFETETMREERFDRARNATLEVRTFDYYLAPSMGSGPVFFEEQKPPTSQRPLRKVTIERGADRYTTEYFYDFSFTSPTYSYNKPTRILASSNVSQGTRETLLTYSHRKDVWAVALPASVTRNGVVFESHGYDALGRQTSKSGVGQPPLTHSYKDEPAGRGVLDWSEDALKRRTTFSDYKRGQPRNTDHPDGTSTSVEIDDHGQITEATDERGHTTTYAYDSMGRMTRMVPPQGDRVAPATTIDHPVVDGLRRKVVTRGPQVTTTFYDGLNRPVLVQEAATGATTIWTRTAYDGVGQETFASFPSFSLETIAGETMSYDALGRVLSERENVAPFATTTYRYLDRNRQETTDPDGNVMTTAHSGYGDPEDGDVVRIEQPLDVTTELTRDLNGYLLAVRQSGSHGGHTVDQTQRWFYDGRYRMCRHSVPESGDTLYEYDAADQEIGMARGQPQGTGCVTSLPAAARIVRSYDDRGRVTGIDYPDTTGDVTYDYDDNGNLTLSRRIGGGEWTYDHNDNNQLEHETFAIDGRTYVTRYEYNTNGYLLRQITPDARRIELAPDGFGRPTQALIGGTIGVFQVMYHPNGRASGMQLKNGLSTAMGQNPRQLVSSIATGSAAAPVVGLTYDYDIDRKIRAITDAAVAGQNRTFRYDALGRLETATGAWGSATFGYDSLGNVRSKTLGSRTVSVGYDARNRVSQVADSARGTAQIGYAHDARGNVTDNGDLELRYDLADQPVSVSGTSTGTYAYDANFKRVKQTVNGDTVYSIYGKSGALLFRDATTRAKRTDYVQAAGMTVMRVDTGNVPTYLHNDHLGSPVAATSQGGQVLWREHYAPYGEKLAAPQANQNDTGFTGHVEDAATGLVYMQARYYDPVIGRFLSTDAADFTPERPFMFNRYAYAGNDPINALDPTGDVRVFVTAYKVAKRAVHFRGNVGKALKSELTSIVENGTTLLNSSASTEDRVLAAIDLATGLGQEARAGKRALNTAVNWIGGKRGEAVRDRATKNTEYLSATYKSEREARSVARTKLGANAVEVAPGKLRSTDGKWQYRAKPDDLEGHGPDDTPHVHLERLNPETGEVLTNWHFRWQAAEDILGHRRGD
jgi:RHS repeat-associated protein